MTEPPRYRTWFDVHGLLMLVACALFVAAFLVAVDVFDGDVLALLSAGLAVTALSWFVD